MGDQKPTMIHGGIRRIVAHRLPCTSASVKSERHPRRFSRQAVVANSIVVIRIIRAPGKINSVCFFPRWFSAGGDAITGSAGMRRQFCPYNFGYVALMRDLSHPAFVGCNVLGTTPLRF